MRENTEKEIGNEIIGKYKKILKKGHTLRKREKKVRIPKKGVCNQIIKAHKEHIKSWLEVKLLDILKSYFNRKMSIMSQ